MPRALLKLAVLLLLPAFALGGCAAKRPPSTPSISSEAPYVLGSGDRLRITVFDQPNLSASYSVDASGVITMPLIGPVEAMGRTTYDLERVIEARLAKDYLRNPNVSVEIEAYRPFFIFGEVTLAGQYPYVAGMTAEQAVAIAGGYTPRARQGEVELSRRDARGVVRVMVPMTTLIRPGDTLFVKERWF